MTVKELMSILEQVHPEKLVYCGYDQDNPLDASLVTHVIEITAFQPGEDEKNYPSGVYLRMR